MENNETASKSNTNTFSSRKACAACKYQRRKCGRHCLLSSYFPCDRSTQFVNVHRLFGVGKINKMLKLLHPRQRDVAMATFIYEAEMRAANPVGGCHSIIKDLESQIKNVSVELQQLRLLLEELAKCKAKCKAESGTEAKSHGPPGE